MLLDDLLNDEPAMRRLAGLFRRRPRRTPDGRNQESFLDEAALYEDLIGRLDRYGEEERREPTPAIRKD